MVGRNASVERFRKLTQELKRECLEVAASELDVQADRLVAMMKSVAPVRSGALRASIRKEEGRKPLQVVIKAGGLATTKEVRKGSGVPYDYSRADEFGTHDVPAHPFFFPTFRLLKKSMQAAVKRKLTAAVKKRSA